MKTTNDLIIDSMPGVPSFRGMDSATPASTVINHNTMKLENIKAEADRVITLSEFLEEIKALPLVKFYTRIATACVNANGFYTIKGLSGEKIFVTK